MKNVLCAIALAGAVVPWTSAEASPPAEAAAVEAQFERWEAALETRDPAAVAALFAHDAVLQPTVSNEVRATPDRIEASFVDFLALSPVPTVLQRHVRVLDDTTAIDAGVWSFRILVDGREDTVIARYSFVWEKVEGVWRIQLLHSSLLPEPVAP